MAHPSTPASYSNSCHTPMFPAALPFPASLPSPSFSSPNVSREKESDSISIASDLETPEDSLAMMVRKMAVLKNGIKTERKKAVALEAELTTAKAKILDLESRLKEQATSAVPESLRDGRPVSPPSSPLRAPPKSDLTKLPRKDLEAMAQQLETQVFDLSQRLSEISLPDLRRSISHEREAELLDRVSRLENEVSQTRARSAHEHKGITAMNSALLKEHREVVDKCSQLASELKQGEEQRREQADAIVQLTSLNTKLETDLEQQTGIMKMLAKKLVAYKTKIRMLQLPLQRFSLHRVTSHGRVQSQLAITKNPATHSFSIEIQTQGTVSIYPLEDVLEVVRAEASGSRFTIRFNRAKQATFESEESEVVLRAIRDFMGACEELRRNPE